MDLSGYPLASVEKIGRLFDVLERIGNMRFLAERLSFYGGSALNFVHFDDAPRLSVDLDFNYRHLDNNRDWGDVRKEIDGLLLRVLKDLGYKDENIKVQPRYPLGRMDIRYARSEGNMDNIKARSAI